MCVLIKKEMREISKTTVSSYPSHECEEARLKILVFTHNYKSKELKIGKALLPPVINVIFSFAFSVLCQRFLLSHQRIRFFLPYFK